MGKSISVTQVVDGRLLEINLQQCCVKEKAAVTVQTRMRKHIERLHAGQMVQTRTVVEKKRFGKRNAEMEASSRLECAAALLGE